MKDSIKTDVTTSILLDTRKKRHDGTYTVKLRVTFKRSSRFYATKYFMSKEDFKRVMGDKPRGDIKDIRNDLAEIEKKAAKVISKLRVFSFDEFRSGLLGKSNNNDIFGALTSYSEMLRKEGRIGSAITYECALSSFKKFWPKSILHYYEVTPKFLKSYEAWMIADGNSETTVGIYLRSLRRMINLAIKKGEFNNEDYPFGADADHYTIPEPRNIKKALPLQEIGKIFAYVPEENSPEHFYRDIWIFSYLCNGINIKDICLLKYRDIDNDSIQFRRAKTQKSNRRSKPITAYKTDLLGEIIKRWGTNPVEADSYVFQFLKAGIDPAEEKTRINQVVKQTNKYIDRVAVAVGITFPVTTYTARHSFATVLKRSGVNIAYISEALGHSNLQTTESYLGSFEIDEKKRIAKNLTSFKKK